MPPKPAADLHDGPVVFVEGVHYPVDNDGHADKTRPLRWVEGSTYRPEEADEPLHNDVHHQQEVVIVPHGDEADEAITLSPSEAEAVRRLLAELRGGG